MILKILHVSETLKGGVASHLDEIIPLQVASYGSENVRILVSADQQSELTGDARSCVSSGSVWSRRSLGLYRMSIDFVRTVREFKPDTVHLHSTFAGAVLRIVLFIRFRSLAVVYCPHGWSFGMEIGTLRKKFYGLVERILSVRTTSILNVSHFEKELAIKYNIDESKLKVIHNGISENLKFTSKPLQWNKDVRNYLFIGRLDRQKGVKFVIDAARNLVDEPVHFHIVGGSVKSSERPDWVAGSYPNVTFYGWVPRAEVFSYIDQCDALLMPSRWEGMPITALEAMRQGKAVLASNRSCMPEVIEDNYSGRIFDIDKPDALEHLLRSLSGDELSRLGEQAATRFQAKYTSERQSREIIELYNSIGKPLGAGQLLQTSS